MLVEPKLKKLHELIESATKEEIVWINGFLAGVVFQDKPQQPVESPKAQLIDEVDKKITIVYGTETGNSKKIASDLAANAKRNGIKTKLKGLDQYRVDDLSKEDYLFVVISTHGEGDPPESARKFYDHIHGNGFKLDKLKFAVLALGDSAYPLYCKAGEDVDKQLSQLGANRLIDLKTCDVDFDRDATEWVGQAINVVRGQQTFVPSPQTKPRTQGKKIYTGNVRSNTNLNDRGSGKRTHHIEFESDAVYEPGDSIGVVAENPRQLVEAIVSITGVDGDSQIQYRNETYTISNLIRKKINITYLPERVVRKYGSITSHDIPPVQIDLLDLLKIYPVKGPEEFVEVISILEPISPRLYSISSSPEYHRGEVHITVALDSFKINEELKYGLCSDYLLNLPVDAEFDFYVQKNNLFRLPSPEKDVIMIGPGTGIAPFRSFLSERDTGGAAGRNWLFFGDQHFTTDFLYQAEIQDWVQTGVLTKVNVAFSRDQEEKVYVQHKLVQQGAEVFEWLEGGAHLYVCGNKDPMSVDVESSILELIEKHGQRSPEEAVLYLARLKDEGRYSKDVY